MPKLPNANQAKSELKTPPKLPSTTGAGNDGGWDLREVATDFLLGELIRRGMAITIRPRSEIPDLGIGPSVAKPKPVKRK